MYIYLYIYIIYFGWPKIQNGIITNVSQFLKKDIVPFYKNFKLLKVNVFYPLIFESYYHWNLHSFIKTVLLDVRHWTRDWEYKTDLFLKKKSLPSGNLILTPAFLRNLSIRWHKGRVKKNWEGMNWSYQNRHNFKIRLNILKDYLVHNMIFSLTGVYFKIEMQFSTSMRLLPHPYGMVPFWSVRLCQRSFVSMRPCGIMSTAI